MEKYKRVCPSCESKNCNAHMEMVGSLEKIDDHIECVLDFDELDVICAEKKVIFY